MLTLKNTLYLLLETVELPKYNSKKDFEKFLQWLDIHNLPFLGKGMSRTVYDLEDGTVLKVANDSFRISHNKDEVEIIKCMNGQLVPELIDFEPNYFWLRLEKVEKVTEEDIYNYWVKQRGLNWKPKVGIIYSIHDFVDEFRNALSDILDSSSNKTFLNSEHNMAVIKPLLDLLDKCNFNPSDLHVENWGKTKNGNLIMIDLGGQKLR